MSRSTSSADTALAVSSTSIPYPTPAALAPRQPSATGKSSKTVADGYLEIGDTVKMRCGVYAGEPGFVMHTGVRPITDWAGHVHQPPAGTIVVYLWRRDIEIVTVVAHVRRTSRREGAA